MLSGRDINKLFTDLSNQAVKVMIFGIGIIAVIAFILGIVLF